jgi:hypothetical protein
MARRKSSKVLTLSHTYPGLWLGGGVLAFLGANFLYLGIRIAVAPPAPGPGGGPEGIAVAIPLLIGGTVFLGLGALLGWIAYRWSERFDVDQRGITWCKGGRELDQVPWDDIQRIQLQDVWGNLVLETSTDHPDLVISKGYKNFDEFLELLQTTVDWETLVRARPAGAPPSPRADGAGDAPPPAWPEPGKSRDHDSPPPAGSSAAPPASLKLPMVRNRPLPFRMSVAGTALLAALSVVLLSLPATAPKTNLADPAARKKAEDEAADENVLRYGTPFLCLLVGTFIFTTWRQFQVDANGIELRYFLRSRRWDWRDLSSVRVHLRAAGSDAYQAHVPSLVITFRAGKPLTLAFGNESFNFREAMVAAATRQGVTLQTDS